MAEGLVLWEDKNRIKRWGKSSYSTAGEKLALFLALCRATMSFLYLGREG